MSFGQLGTPTDRWVLEYLKGGSGRSIPLAEMLGMTYQQLSAQGTSYRGYASMWLYYQYLRRHYASQLAAFETALAQTQASGDAVRGHFLQSFGLAGDAGLVRLETEALAWVGRQDVSKEESDQLLTALEAVTSKLPLSYIYRRRAPALLPD